MPVGTQATVKGLTPRSARGRRRPDHPRQHLSPRPAARRRADRRAGRPAPLHGLGRRRSSPTAAAFRSSASPTSRKITDDAAVFRSHIDGRLLELTPERAVAHPGKPRLRHRHVPGRVPARRTPTRTYMRDGRPPDDPLGRALPGRPPPGRPGAVRHRPGRHRRRTADRVCRRRWSALDFPGYALGGFSVGETPAADGRGAGADGGAAAGRQAALPDGRRPAAGHARRRRRRHRPVRLRAADAQRPQCLAPSPPTGRCGCATPATSEIRRRWSPVASATPAGTSAGRTCITCSRRRRCSGRRCCRCTTWRYYLRLMARSPAGDPRGAVRGVPARRDAEALRSGAARTRTRNLPVSGVNP